jgi:uncharacterized protein
MVTRYDFVELKATRTDDGFIKDTPVITRVGIFEYRTSTGQLKREFRSDTEILSAESLSSIAGIPITNNHSGLVSGDNATHVVGTVLSQGRQDGSNVIADVVVYNVKAIGVKRELSLGYTCEIDEAPGEWNGQRYDCSQKNVRYNHLAVVTKGRAGNARLRLDSTDAVNGSFTTENEMTETKLVGVRLDNIEYQASPEVANKLVKMEGDLVDRQRSIDGVTAERDTLKQQLLDTSKQIEETRKTAFAQVRDRVKLETLIGTLGIKFEEDENDRSLKEKTLKKLRASIDLEGKSDDYVNSAFDMAIAYEAERNTGTSKQQARADSARFHIVPKAENSASAARERMLAKIRGEKESA